MKHLLVFLGVFLLQHILCDANLRVDPLVKIDQGLVRGQQITDGQNMYAYFLGIPYAQVDENDPFGPAQPPPSFDAEIFDANDGSVRCPQSPGNNLETPGCLTLNIYVPVQASSQNSLPVLVWIHGGLYIKGSGAEQNPQYLVKHGIIVVTINYRLGAYGFMCLDTHLMPGNQGLKDQYEALRWVRNNIAAFGGNPNEVTLAGQSAGACSTLLHLYSNKEKLFNQLIVQSGTPLSEGMFVKGDYDAAIKLATHLGFNTTDDEEALNFLAKTSSSLVIEAQAELNLVLRPCREKSFSGVDYFIADNPLDLSNENKIRDTPIMIGHTSMEALGSLLTYGENYFDTNPFYDVIVSNFELEEDCYNEVAAKVKNFYIGDEPVSVNLTLELETFHSDFVFNSPTQRVITNLLNENANPVFEYLFSYKEDENATGAGHSDELKYLFGLDMMQRTVNEREQLMIDRLTTLWANFVKYGNPTPEKTDIIPVIWEPIQKDTRPYLNIGTDLKVEHRVFKERMAFWDLFYSVYGDKYKFSSRSSCYKV